MGIALLCVTCFLAFANGANDNFKGVASLFGSDTVDYRTAIGWATATTLAGSIASIYLAHGLVVAFSGEGLVPDTIAAGRPFLLAVACGAGATVLLATRLGFPISTTHGLVGAIAGAGLVAAGPGFDAGALGSAFVTPLLVSPVLALVLAAALYAGLHVGRRRLGIDKEGCLCVGEASPVLPDIAGVAAARTGASLAVFIGHRAECEARYSGAVLGVRWQQGVDAAHFVSAGVVSFARGLNDTPKIAALLLVLHAVDVRWGHAIVGASIALGGLLGARSVAITMSRRITGMNHGQGFTANLATGLMVIVASRFGFPVSTTHVSVGSLLGIGLLTRQADLSVTRNVILSWLVTLPCAAAIAAIVFRLAGA